MPRTTPPPVALRGRLRSLIDADGRSHAAIAGAAGMSQAQLSQILTGVRPNPTVETVERLLSALGRRWADLD
jgi:transcriptional regulator with XRE-family HTH domain